MIIPNGYIRFNKSTEATTNGDGYFVVAPGAWGEEIECQYLSSINLQARSQGEATTSHAYTIYVEQMVKLPSEVVKLYDRDNNEIGQFSVRSYEQLDAVCQTKIVL